MNELKQQDLQIRDAQYRKGLSIAFFNATNSAISLLSATMDRGSDVDLVLKKVFEIRDKMLEEHKKYYSEVIAQIGVNYRAVDTIAKLDACKDMEELRSVWLSLSEDERRDGSVIIAKETLKNKYEKA